MKEKQDRLSPAHGLVSKALHDFNVPYLQEVWAKAIARRTEDPDGAITSARTLLESVCKHILEAKQIEYQEGLPLPRLYEKTAQALDIAPTPETEPVFTKLFEGCAAIVESVGSLRNNIGDAHGRGAFAQLPDWRHAELAVHLSGAMATYLLATWESRQPTLAELIERFMSEREAGTKPLGKSTVFGLRRLQRLSIGKRVASKLRAEQIIEFCRELRGDNLDVSTVHQYVSFIRGVLNHAKSKWKLDVPVDVIKEAEPTLKAEQLVGKSKARDRRPTHEEFDRLIAYFRKADSLAWTRIPMAVIAEFAVWTGRQRGEICEMRWEDVDMVKRTCVVRGEKFPLLGKAWDIVEAQPRTEGEPRIFPYNAESVGKRYIEAKKALGIEDLRFNDSRREAAYRQYKAGFAPHEIARATGHDVQTVVEMCESFAQEEQLAVRKGAPSTGTSTGREGDNPDPLQPG